MSNLVKLEFIPLEISGNNYMAWTLDIEMHFGSMDLLETIQGGNNSSRTDNARSLIFLRGYLDGSLKNEYLTVRDPIELWRNLKERFGNQKDVMLLIYHDNWNNLRFQDYKKVSEYNFAMFEMVTHLNFCGVTITDNEMLEKTISTFCASNVTLQQQYRMRSFTRYSELIACLLIAKKNNELLMKNHQSCLTGTKAFTEGNVVNSDESERKNYFQGRERGRGRGSSYGCDRGGYNLSYKSDNYHHKKQQSERNTESTHKRGKDVSSSKRSGTSCYRCGSKGHKRKRGRRSTSMKEKGKEDNFNESTHLEASDFNDDFIDTVGDFVEQADGGN